jgi:hypothetical protein
LNPVGAACVYVFGYSSQTTLSLIIIMFFIYTYHAKKVLAVLPSSFSLLGFLPDHFCASKDVRDIYYFCTYIFRRESHF